MPRKLNYNRGRLFNIQVSEMAYLFINRYATGHHQEPKYRTVDRMIGNFMRTDKAVLIEEIIQLKETIKKMHEDEIDLGVLGAKNNGDQRLTSYQ